MALEQDPRNGINYNWDLGASFKTEMDENFRKLGSIINPSVINFPINSPPPSPTNGDAYIVGAAPTGVFIGHTNDIAIWFGEEDTPAWLFFPPTTGQTCVVQTGTHANELIMYNGTSWLTNGFTFS